MTAATSAGRCRAEARGIAPSGSVAAHRDLAPSKGAWRVRALSLLALAAGVLSGCLLDIYGGVPRTQLENRSARPVRSVTLGTPSAPAWSRTFTPPVAPGQRSQTFDLPVAGDLRLYAIFEGADSIRALETGRFEAGTFTRIVVRDSVAQP